MDGMQLIDIARAGFMTFVKAGLPVMLVALAIGFVISLLQAMTQIQEQTLVYVPKIVATLLALLFLLPFMGEALAAYMTRIAGAIAGGG